MNKDDCGLYIVATPIGNLNDISKRAVETIKVADFIICENPKHSLKLLNNLGIKKKLISLHDYNEDNVIKKIGKDLKNKKVALISDSGSPLISDPGFKLIQFCIKNNIFISTIPGASSIIPALQLSGLPSQEFCFYGFVPKNSKQMLEFCKKIMIAEQTSVCFVSSHRITKFIEVLENLMGNRQISISKELTKLNELVFRGSVTSVMNDFLSKKENTRGEFVVTIAKNEGKKNEFFEFKDYESLVKKLLLKFSLTDVVEIVHKLLGKNKNEIYKWVLNLKEK